MYDLPCRQSCRRHTLSLELVSLFSLHIIQMKRYGCLIRDQLQLFVMTGYIPLSVFCYTEHNHTDLFLLHQHRQVHHPLTTYNVEELDICKIRRLLSTLKKSLDPVFRQRPENQACTVVN